MKAASSACGLLYLERKSELWREGEVDKYFSCIGAQTKTHVLKKESIGMHIMIRK